jgi:uncharacterized protein
MMIVRSIACVALGVSALVGCARPSSLHDTKTSGSSATAATARGNEDLSNVLDERSVQSLADASSSQLSAICSQAPAEAFTDDRATLYGKACKANDGESCTKLGAMYMCGVGVQKSNATAAAMFEKACNLHQSDGCQYHAGALLSGNLGKRDTVSALRILQRACNVDNSASACSTLGSILMMMGKPETIALGGPYLERACNAGNYGACGNLSIVELNGMGGRPKNETKAFKLASQGCEKQSAFACGVLGSFYMNGTAVKKDEAAAAKLFAFSCEGGEAMGCMYLGACHYQGSGVTQDVSKAAELFRKACDGGNGQSCRLLAEMSGRPSSSASAPTTNPTMF